MLAPQRKFLKGLVIGLLAGFAVGAALSEQQRKQLVSEVKKTASPLGKSITDNVSHVADTAVGEIAAKIDDAGDTAASKLSSDADASDKSATG